MTTITTKTTTKPTTQDVAIDATGGSSTGGSSTGGTSTGGTSLDALWRHKALTRDMVRDAKGDVAETMVRDARATLAVVKDRVVLLTAAHRLEVSDCASLDKTAIFATLGRAWKRAGDVTGYAKDGSEVTASDKPARAVGSLLKALGDLGAASAGKSLTEKGAEKFRNSARKLATDTILGSTACDWDAARTWFAREVTLALGAE